ncbi:Metalloenzyme, LuxS/M16 peptidase-like protein [Amylostereum chailletii]|nr:Metalloenzyme, LuxS/M16 peptidase-like protein [Amylostereum chailletii]
MAVGAPEDLANWRRVDPATEKRGGFSVYTKPIQKSEQDDREYRLIELDNGLQAMLVQDAKADKAAASLDVAVGHLHDPDDMPGLAHFCEHLLFMGTEHYSKENEYSEYLSRNSGHSNAYTSTTNTNYYFNVAPSALSGAISRFAGFFHSPLFSPSCTTRELNAVDSEHKKNHQADLWRIYQVNKHLSKPGHPWRKFGSGNKQSLTQVGRDLKIKSLTDLSVAPSPIPSRMASPAPSVSSVSSDVEADGGPVGRETRRRLVEWWSEEYCASRMRLCIIGKDSLDDLADLVVENFSPILNRNKDPLPLVSENPFGDKEKGTLVSVQTIMAIHCMEISFPLAYQAPLWQHKPGSYLGDLVGHEGPGSLHSYLKNKGWITALNSGPQNLARGFAMFKVTLYMTEDGFQNHRAVALAVFNYLSMLRSSAIPLWYQKERSAISNTRFRFSEKRRPEDYAIRVTDDLGTPVPRELVLKGPRVVWEWDAEGKAAAEVARTLDGLRVDQGRAVLMGRKEEHDKAAGGPREWQTEPIYGTQYRVDPFDADFSATATGPNTISALHLPFPNDFIPQNLDVERRDVTEPQPRPHLIRQTELSNLWHKKDDRFWIPKTHLILELRTPVANASPTASVLTKLYSDLVTDSLTEYSYAADLAGLTYNFAASNLGIYIIITGYNDKLDVLLRNVLERVKALEVRPERLELVHFRDVTCANMFVDQAKLEWENFFLGQTYRISDYYGRYLMNEKQWTITEKLQALPSITVAQVQDHITKLLSQVHNHMLVVGNTYKADAINLLKMSEDILGASPLSEPEPVDLSLILPKGSNYVWSTPVPNPDEPNSALTYYTHLGPLNDQRLRVTGSLLAQILSEPAFNILRTQEQLGYIVSASSWPSPGMNETGLRIVVQSERVPVYLEGRVEAFLEHMRGVVGDMDEETFKQEKDSLQNKWREAPKNISEELSRFWGHVDSGYLDFERRRKDAELLDTITKEDVLSLFMSKVHPSSTIRSKLSIHLVSQKPRPGHVSVAAAEAFAKVVKDAGVVIDDAKWKEELIGEGEPSVPDFAKFWQTALAGGSSDLAAKLVAAMPEIMKQYPAEKDAEGELAKNAVHIQDVQAFRKSLKVSEPPRPLVEWNDLPTSRF